MTTVGHILDDPPRLSTDFVLVFRRSGLMYIALGAIIAVCGLVVVATSLFGPVADASGDILKYGGMLVASGSLPLFQMGWGRLERISTLGILLARWEQVAQAGDPHQEIPELKKIYFKLIRDGLGVKEPA